jgi:RNA polymerase sigma-70 factor (ECF subfamily)
MPESFLPEITDEDIVARALEQKEAFGELVRRYQEKLSRYIRRLGVFRSEDVEDVLQNVFLSVYRNLNGFDRSLRFSSWIYRITHNEVMSFFRSRQARPEGYVIDESEERLTEIQSSLSVEREVEHVLNRDLLAAALAKLDPKYRDILVLRFFEEREYAEISDILKLPIGTVGTQINRAKKRLHDLLSSPL